MFKLYLSVFVRLLSVFNVNCMHQGSESYAISILCMYVLYVCGRIDNKADLTWLDLIWQRHIPSWDYFQALRNIIAPAAPMVRQQSSLIITPEWEYSS